jgi:hypothetical protein
MKIFQTKLFFVFLAVASMLTACIGGGGNANLTANGANSATNANANATKDDAEEFGRIVNLSVTPEEVAWRESDAQNQKKLLAVLKFSSENAQTIVSQAERHKPAAQGETDAENWFPPELVAQSQQSGDEVLRGNTYAANDFILEPYKTGKLTRINDTNYFVLELSSAEAKEK